MTLTLIAVLLGLVAGSVYAILRAHEEQKAKQRLRSLQAAVELTMILDQQCGRVPESRDWPAPTASHKQPWRAKRKPS